MGFPPSHARIGLNLSNTLLVLDAGDLTQPRGIVPDLGRDLAQCLGHPEAFTGFPDPASWRMRCALRWALSGRSGQV